MNTTQARVTTKKASGPRSAGPSAGRPAPGATSEAQRRAAVILEVLAGVRTAQDAAGVLKISSNHYYLLERKALGGLVRACEPAPRRVRMPTAEKRIRQLEQELERCRRDCQRQAALVRAAQRAIGLPLSPPITAQAPAAKARRRRGEKTRRRRSHPPRGVTAARALQKTLAAEPPVAVQPWEDGREADRSGRVNEEPNHGAARAETAEVGARGSS